MPSNLYDLDMERAIISSIFYSEDGYSEIQGLINEKDFYLKGHSDIFRAINDCVKNDEPIDFAFVKKRLSNKYDEQIFSDVIAANSIIDIVKYANELKEKSVKRSLIKLAHKIPSKVNENIASKDMVDEISANLYSLIENFQSGNIKESPQIISELLEEIKKQKQNLDKDLVGLDTGFRYLNEYTKGFKEGELIIVAARPGMGKTAFVLNLMQKSLNLGKGIVFFSLEMPASQLMMRLISAITSISLSNILTAKMTDDEFTRFGDACNDMLEKKLFVYDESYVNIHKVRTELRKLKSKHEEISLCIIDYIGLMTSSSNFSERHLQIADISRGLKLLARELKIPIIALSQLNRGLESRANKRPMLSDLRESGAIEQDADVILFVYRGDVYAQQEEDERREKWINEGKSIQDYQPKFVPNANGEKAEIIVGKNRNGALGSVEVTYQKEFTRFIDGSFGAVFENSFQIDE
ncbi:replicative DNA helicase [Campylobacter portucalensis]|uniref:replicative DNA helicase n=1 Tax=Campylobacter portucalensis TaxID=2608384 RepID=UPI003898E0AE